MASYGAPGKATSGYQTEIAWLRDGTEDGRMSGRLHIQMGNFLFLKSKRLQRPDSNVTLKLQAAPPELHEGLSVRLHFANGLICNINLQGVHEAETLRNECAVIYEKAVIDRCGRAPG